MEESANSFATSDAAPEPEAFPPAPHRPQVVLAPREYESAPELWSVMDEVEETLTLMWVQGFCCPSFCCPSSFPMVAFANEAL